MSIQLGPFNLSIARDRQVQAQALLKDLRLKKKDSRDLEPKDFRFGGDITRRAVELGVQIKPEPDSENAALLSFLHRPHRHPVVFKDKDMDFVVQRNDNENVTTQSLPEAHLRILNWLDSFFSDSSIRQNILDSETQFSQEAQLIKPEFIAYLNAWKEKINPTNKDLSVRYAFSGPDLVTPLLAANATKLEMINNADFPVETQWLSQLDTSDLESFKKFIDGLGLFDRKTSFSDKFQEALTNRFDSGYWATHQIGIDHNLGRIRTLALIYELVSLGATNISFDFVESVSSSKLIIKSIKFDWRHPDEESSKSRIIQMKNIKVNENDTIEGPDSKQALEEVDCYIQKSTQGLMPSPVFLDKVKNKGFYFMGLDFSTSSRVNQLAYRVSHCQQLCIPEIYSTNLKSVMDRAYGWEMGCFQKNT